MGKILVTCLGQQILDFPVDRINTTLEGQTIKISAILYKGTTYSSGAYVRLKKISDDHFAIEGVATQPHFLKSLCP